MRAPGQVVDPIFFFFFSWALHGPPGVHCQGRSLCCLGFPSPYQVLCDSNILTPWQDGSSPHPGPRLPLSTGKKTQALSSPSQEGGREKALHRHTSPQPWEDWASVLLRRVSLGPARRQLFSAPCPPSPWGWQDLLLSPQQEGLPGPGHSVLATLSSTVWEVPPRLSPAMPRSSHTPGL